MIDLHIDLNDIDYNNIAAWLCGNELSEEQKIDVLKYQMRKKKVL